MTDGTAEALLDAESEDVDDGVADCEELSVVLLDDGAEEDDDDDD